MKKQGLKFKDVLIIVGVSVLVLATVWSFMLGGYYILMDFGHAIGGK